MPPLLRPAAERFHSQLDWLDNWHAFLSSHYDPAWMGFGPLRVINDDVIAAGKGSACAPDMEIITVMVEGGCTTAIPWATPRCCAPVKCSAWCGTGVVHSEVNGGESPCRLLQIWIEPASAGIAPAYEQKPFALQQGWTPLIDPDAAGEAMAIHRPVRLWRAQVDAGTQLPWPASGSCASWMQIINGGLASPQPLSRGDGLGLAAAEAPHSLEAGAEGVDLLLFELS